MNRIKEVFDYYFNIVCFCLIIFLLTGIIYLIYINKSPKKEIIKTSKTADNYQTNLSNNNKIKVDIKGAVKKPGVYELDNNSTVDDLIKLSGGLKKNATTDNINLSKVLENQMVIKIHTKAEYNKTTTTVNNNISECICPNVDITPCIDAPIVKIDETSKKTINNENNILSNDTNSIETSKNTLISINTATKEELMTLPGIGESKAISIIEYRNNNAFKAIEEIKNVSGIGDVLYEKIKDYISI